MNETTAQAFTRDDIRAIVHEEASKVGGLLLLGVNGVSKRQVAPAHGVSNEDPYGSLRHLKVEIHGLGVDLKGALVAVDELGGNRRVQPQEVLYNFSTVLGAEDANRESLAFAEAFGRDDLNVRNVGVTEPLKVHSVVNESCHSSSPYVDDAGAHSVGDGPGAGDASATPATGVTDPHISARYDAPLNAIAMSVGGTDDLYFDRDATFLLVDELRAALHDQAKNGGLA